MSTTIFVNRKSFFRAHASAFDVHANLQQRRDLLRSKGQRSAGRDFALQLADAKCRDGLTRGAERDLATTHRQSVPRALLAEPLFLDYVVGLNPSDPKPTPAPALDILRRTT
jgi:hypothetical protein